MGKRKRKKPKIVSSTGIYCEVESPPISDPEEQAAMWREAAANSGIKSILRQAENSVKELLRHFEGDIAGWDGKPTCVKRSSAEFPWAIPEDAPADVKRAREIMWQVHICREKLDAGNAESAALAAFRLGRMWECLQVFPFERFVQTQRTNQKRLPEWTRANKGDPEKKKKMCVKHYKRLKKQFPNRNMVWIQEQAGIEAAIELGLPEPIPVRTVQRYLQEKKKPPE